MNKHEEINELAKGLAKFHATVPSIATNKEVAYSGTKFKYANLAGILDTIRKPLAEAGLSIVQAFNGGDLVTTLLHESGQSLSSTIGLGITPVVDHKKLGAAITYMRRYALISLLNLAADEDEAEEPGVHVEVKPSIKKPELIEGLKLNEKQVISIKELLGNDTELLNRILDGYAVNSLEDIEMTHFNLIMKNLQARKAK